MNARKAPGSCLQEQTNIHHKEFSIAGDFLCPFSVKASFQNIVVCIGQKYFSRGSVFFLISEVLFDLLPAPHMVQRSGRKLHRAERGRCMHQQWTVASWCHSYLHGQLEGLAGLQRFS